MSQTQIFQLNQSIGKLSIETIETEVLKPFRKIKVKKAIVKAIDVKGAGYCLCCIYADL